MPNAKVSALTEATALTDDDLLVLVDDTGGTPLTKKITVANARASLGSITGVSTANDTNTSHDFGLPGYAPLSINATYNIAENNRRYFVPFSVPTAITVSALRCEITTLQAASTARLAILSADSNWGPNQTNAVRWTNTVDTSTTGVKDITGLSVVLPAGNYYLTLAGSTTGIVFRSFTGQPTNGAFLTQGGQTPRLYGGATGANAPVDPVGELAGNMGGILGFSVFAVLKWTVNTPTPTVAFDPLDGNAIVAQSIFVL